MWLRVLDDHLGTRGMTYLLTNPMLRNDLRESLILLSHSLTFVYFHYFSLKSKTEANNMLMRAERLQIQVDELKENAYKLDESLRPKKGRPKKATKETIN